MTNVSKRGRRKWYKMWLKSFIYFPPFFFPLCGDDAPWGENLSACSALIILRKFICFSSRIFVVWASENVSRNIFHSINITSTYVNHPSSEKCSKTRSHSHSPLTQSSNGSVFFIASERKGRNVVYLFDERKIEKIVNKTCLMLWI